MVSTPLFYHLLVISLLWLCFLLHVLWPYERPVPRLTPPEPTLPPRRRSTEPKPFPGLLHKPLCDAWAQAAASRLQAPGAPPPMLPGTRGADARSIHSSSSV